MDEAWERVVEAALDGQGTPSSELRVLNLDGAVKSIHGCLPPALILERFPILEQLSIANVGALSLEKFPRLRNLQRLILSDNRIAGGLENLVHAGLHSLRDLDLSNNRIQYIEDLTPLAKLQLVSLDLYECPVTRVSDYRSKVFSMIRTLKYLDKLDANEEERPDTDEEDEEDDDYEYDDVDPGSGEVDADDRSGKMTNGGGDFADIDDVIVEEDEESDADEDEMETSGRGTRNGFTIGSSHKLPNGFRLARTGDADDDVEVDDEDDDDDLGEEIDEEEGDENEAIDVHDVLESDEDDEDGVGDLEDDGLDVDEDDDEDLEDDDELDVDEEEVGVEEEDDTKPRSSGRFARFEEEIDGHDHEEDNENGEIGLHDGNGEIGEEEHELLIRENRVVHEDFDDEDDLDGDYLVQPVSRPNGHPTRPDFITSDSEDLDSEDDDRRNFDRRPSSDNLKRRRDEKDDSDDGGHRENPRKRRH